LELAFSDSLSKDNYRQKQQAIRTPGVFSRAYPFRSSPTDTTTICQKS